MNVIQKKQASGLSATGRIPELWMRVNPCSQGGDGAPPSIGLVLEGGAPSPPGVPGLPVAHNSWMRPTRQGASPLC